MQLTGCYGTYFSPESSGVYRFTLNTGNGVPENAALLYAARDAKCMCRVGGGIAAPVQQGEQAGLVRFGTDGAKEAQALFEHGTGCFLADDGTYLYSANYHEGTVTVCARDTLRPVHRIEAGAGAGCHQVLLHGGLLLVPCLERDEVRIYKRGGAFAQTGALTFAAGTGPRHGVFDSAHRRLFLVSERSNELFCWRVDGVDFTLEQTCTVADGGASAAIRLSPDERFLYLSTREKNLLTVFALEGTRARRLQQVSCGGRHPRDFDLTPDGRWLVCLNRDSGEIVSFAVDRASGRIGPEAGRLRAPQASGLLWL
jgi:6-phosphogluconolactonase